MDGEIMDGEIIDDPDKDGENILDIDIWLNLIEYLFFKYKFIGIIFVFMFVFMFVLLYLLINEILLLQLVSLINIYMCMNRLEYIVYLWYLISSMVMCAILVF